MIFRIFQVIANYPNYSDFPVFEIFPAITLFHPEGEQAAEGGSYASTSYKFFIPAVFAFENENRSLHFPAKNLNLKMRFVVI